MSALDSLEKRDARFRGRLAPSKGGNRESSQGNYTVTKREQHPGVTNERKAGLSES